MRVEGIEKSGEERAEMVCSCEKNGGGKIS